MWVHFRRGWLCKTTCRPPAAFQANRVSACLCTAGLLQLSSGDNLTLGFVAAGAAAAYLRFYAQPAGPGPSAAAAAGGGATLGPASSRPLPPPAELLSSARLAALVRLLKYHPPASGSPALEAIEGSPAR